MFSTNGIGNCIAGAKEGEAFLDEFRAAGFSGAGSRNARTYNPNILAADIYAKK